MKTIFLSILLTMGFSSFSFAADKSTADSRFLDQMTEHHNGAIEMAKLADQKSQDPNVKALAKKIIDDQSKEIAQMAAWRKELFADAKKAKSQHKMSMRGLEKSNGKAFDIEFADMMAKHHKDGVEMVRDFEGDLKNAQIKQFALNIATVQEKEIKELEQMEENLKK